MPSRAQRERSDRRRALRLLADTPEGVTEALMLAHGFRVALLVDLCIAGLAIARPEHMRAGGRTMEVVRHEDHGSYKPRLVGGKVMMPADLERLHKYMLEIEDFDHISDDMRALVEELWPELAHKLPART